MDDRSEADRSTPLERIAMIVIATPCICFAVWGLFGMLFAQWSQVGQGNIAAAKAQIKQFDTTLTAYKITFGVWPDSLDQLVMPPSGDPIMIAKEVPLDPWGNPYQYTLVGSSGYVVVSLGADGEEGGDDEDADIRSDEIVNEAAQKIFYHGWHG